MLVVILIIVVVGVWENIIAIHPTALVGAAIIGIIDDQFPLRATLAAAAVVVISTIVVLWIPFESYYAISIAAIGTDDNIVMNIKKEESPSYHCNDSGWPSCFLVMRLRVINERYGLHLYL